MDVLDGIRLNPQSLEAEMVVIGGSLVDVKVAGEMAGKLRPSQFYRPMNQKIWRAIISLVQANKTPEPILVTELLRNHGLWEDGMAAYLFACIETVPSRKLEEYADIIIEKWTRRELIAATDRAKDLAYDESLPIERVVDLSHSTIFQIGKETQEQVVTSHSLSENSLRNVFRRHTSQELPGISTGFHDFDELTNGLQPGHLVVVMAPPSTGKTAFAMNIVEHVSVDSGLTSLVFSLEMSAEELFNRMVCSRARVSSRDVGRGLIHQNDWRRLTDAHKALSGAPMCIEATPESSVLQMRGKARRIAQERGQLSLVVVDYLQLCDPSSRGENSAERLGQAAQSFKAMGQELKCPVILISSMNNDYAKRENKRPQKTDARGSGAISYAADEMIFLYREPGEDYGTPAEVILDKHRNGPTGTIYLSWQARYARFEDQ